VNSVFAIEELLDRATPEHRYHEFLRIPTMSAGVYVLPAGAVDMQKPHREDEIYYVVRGRARVRIGAQQKSVQPGSIVFVEARAEHRFFDIEEELVLAVVFAPAESL
jgi:mannose-6-phosphate isomerase-like protein (cupin superfamily)